MRNLPNVYSSFCPGAPVLNGTPGSLLDVYKACLVTGTAKISFTGITVANGIARVMAVTEGQVFLNGSRIAVEGCDEPLLNGVFEVDSHNSTSFTYKTTAADGSYGGQIKINQPGAGWQILFTGTNEAVFVSGNLDTLGVCIKISDLTAYTAVFEFYENMTSLTAGVNRADLNGLYGGNRHARISKSYGANANPVAWWLVADNTSCHFANDRWDSNTTTPTIEQFVGGMPFSFGEMSAMAESDKKNFYYNGPSATTGTSNGVYDSNYTFSIGYFRNTTPTDSYTHGCVLTETSKNTRGWMKLYVSATPAVYTNDSAVSAGNKLFRQSYKLRPNFLLAEHFMVGYGPSRYTSVLGDQILLGTLKETKFMNNGNWGQVKNFGIETINGKRYVMVPIFFYYTARSSTTIDFNSVGLMPILIGESWGD